MRENINKVADRGDKIDALGGKADNLVRSTREFRRGANKVRKDMWWKDMKMRMCLIVGIIILLVVIIVPIGKLPPSSERLSHRTNSLPHLQSSLRNKATQNGEVKLWKLVLKYVGEWVGEGRGNL
jgi:hypothetical protein